MNTFWTRLRHAFGAFRKDSEGNVALMFAIAVIPLLGFVGAAIDFSNANSVKAAMQTALDFDRTDAVEERILDDRRPVAERGTELL